MKISLIIPVYNEEKIIVETLRKLSLFINSENDTWEIIIIDDGSKDNTLESLKNFNSQHFKIISYKNNQGKGFAVKRGVKEASGDYICFIDSDLAYSFENIKYAVSHLNDFDIVRGSRDLSKVRENTSILRKIFGKGFNLLSNIILGYHLRDTQCGLKAFKREVAKDLFSNTTLKRFSFDTEIFQTSFLSIFQKG